MVGSATVMTTESSAARNTARHSANMMRAASPALRFGAGATVGTAATPPAVVASILFSPVEDSWVVVMMERGLWSRFRRYVSEDGIFGGPQACWAPGLVR